MGGIPHRRNRWRDECSALEDRLGFSRGFLYEDWRVTVAIRERRSVCVMPREVHEEMALCNLIELYDKAGATGS
jgi:hypothetical protein